MRRSSFADYGTGNTKVRKRPGRPRIIPSAPGPHRETIIVMMRYGGNVDTIAEQLGIRESDLVKYIKDEGLDKLLARRSWKWKAKNKYRRRVSSDKAK